MSRPAHPAASLTEALRRAVGLHQSGRIAEAEGLYRQILKAAPKNANALHLLGVCRRQQGDNETAVRLIREGLTVNPRLGGAWNNLAVACTGLGRWQEAVDALGKAIALTPDAADLYFNRGNALESLQRFDDALANYDRSLALRPDNATALNNRGNLLQRLGRLDEALSSYDRALAVRPDYATAHNNRGTAFQELNRLDEALADYERAIALQPDYADAWLSRSLCHLLRGNYADGWPQYEWRWKTSDGPAQRRSFAQPLWLGREDLSGKSLLVHAEQGLGDTLQFCRYLPAVAGRAARVVLEVQPELKSLLAGLPGATRVLARGEALPEVDYQCPLLSLPLALWAERAGIPAEVPYIPPLDGRQLANWIERLGPRSGPLRVGIVWSGSPQHKNDHNRSLPLSLLQEHLADAPVEFHSLQKTVRPAEQALLERCDWLRRPQPCLGDLADTAALVSVLDLVITVDTSVAHLAGALGRPVWVLLPFAPDWRWLMARPDSPWYPTARLFRQASPGDWHGVLESVRQALMALGGSACPEHDR